MRFCHKFKLIIEEIQSYGKTRENNEKDKSKREKIIKLELEKKEKQKYYMRIRVV
jgi:hypothetical protein